MKKNEAISILATSVRPREQKDKARYDEAVKMAIGALNKSERKTGKWERHYSRPNVYADLCWHCSNCGYKTPDNWANKWKFCPNCGARMVQEGEDNDG